MLSGRKSRGPPSSERDTWTLVSLVMRSTKTLRLETILRDRIRNGYGARIKRFEIDMRMLNKLCTRYF